MVKTRKRNRDKQPSLTTDFSSPAKEAKKSSKKRKKEKAPVTIRYQAQTRLHGGQARLAGVMYDDVTSYKYCHILIGVYREIWHDKSYKGDVTVDSITDERTREIIKLYDPDLSLYDRFFYVAAYQEISTKYNIKKAEIPDYGLNVSQFYRSITLLYGVLTILSREKDGNYYDTNMQKHSFTREVTESQCNAFLQKDSHELVSEFVRTPDEEYIESEYAHTLVHDYQYPVGVSIPLPDLVPIPDSPFTDVINSVNTYDLMTVTDSHSPLHHELHDVVGFFGIAVMQSILHHKSMSPVFLTWLSEYARYVADLQRVIDPSEHLGTAVLPHGDRPIQQDTRDSENDPLISDSEEHGLVGQPGSPSRSKEERFPVLPSRLDTSPVSTVPTASGKDGSSASKGETTSDGGIDGTSVPEVSTVQTVSGKDGSSASKGETTSEGGKDGTPVPEVGTTSGKADPSTSKDVTSSGGKGVPSSPEVEKTIEEGGSSIPDVVTKPDSGIDVSSISKGKTTSRAGKSIPVEKTIEEGGSSIPDVITVSDSETVAPSISKEKTVSSAGKGTLPSPVIEITSGKGSSLSHKSRTTSDTGIVVPLVPKQKVASGSRKNARFGSKEKTTSGKSDPSIPEEVTVTDAGKETPPVPKVGATPGAGKDAPSVSGQMEKIKLPGEMEKMEQFLVTKTQEMQALGVITDRFLAAGGGVPPIPPEEVYVDIGSVITGGSVSSGSTGIPAKPVTPPIQPPPVAEIAPLETSIYLSFRTIVASHGRGSTRDSIKSMFRSDEFKKYDSKMSALDMFDSTRRNWTTVQSSVMAILDNLSK